MAFICNECKKTWPDKKNQIEDAKPDGTFSAVAGDGLCPECADDEDDDDGRSTARRAMTSPSSSSSDDDSHPWAHGGFNG